MPRSAGGEHVCPQDGMPLSLRVVTDSDCDSQEWECESSDVQPEIEPCFDATEHAIRDKILQRPCRRIQALEVDVSENVVTIRGHVTCFHLKQLALQGVFDVMGAGRNYGIELNIRVEALASPSEGEAFEHPVADARAEKTGNGSFSNPCNLTPTIAALLVGRLEKHP